MYVDNLIKKQHDNIWAGLINFSRSPADEASRTQNSANRASPKGAPDWLSFEYGELHLPDFLCVL